MKTKQNVAQIVLFIILLKGLFWSVYIPFNLCKQASFVSGAILAILTFSFIFKRKIVFFKPILAVFFLSILSVVTSYYFHNQSPLLSIRTSIPWFQICFCFFLLHQKANENIVYNAVFVFVIIYIVLYLMAVIAAPEIIFDPSGGKDIHELNLSRGWFRIRIAGSGFLYLMLYWQINKYLTCRKKSNVLYGIICFLMIMLTLSRQHILITIILSLLFILKNQNLLHKISIAILLLLFSLYIVPRMTIYRSLLDLTEMQMEANSGGREDIRIYAYKYYLSYNESVAQDILGNGLYHADSQWGKEIYRTIMMDGLVASDVGWAGLWFYFGLLGIVIIIWFGYVFFKFRFDSQHIFIKYFIAAMFLGTIFSNQMNGCLIEMSIAFYLMYLQSERKFKRLTYA